MRFFRLLMDRVCADFRAPTWFSCVFAALVLSGLLVLTLTKAVCAAPTSSDEVRQQARSAKPGVGQKESRETALVLSVASACAAAAAPACVSAAASLPQSPPAAMDERTAKGLLGDYVGGVWGTGISFLALLGVAFTWSATRKIDYKSKTYQVFAEMLRTHEEIVASIKLGDAIGREAIVYVLKEFSFIYKVTNRVGVAAGWTLEERIDIAYTYLYYGPQLQTQLILQRYGLTHLKQIGDALSKKAHAGRYRRMGRQFKGHQNRLSHYFRNLFAAYAFIDSSRLSDSEKEALGKVLRSKLSNYEQAILCLNVLSHLGRDWEKRHLLARYKPIKNIPKHFFSFDSLFDLKSEFPSLTFEWEEQGT